MAEPCYARERYIFGTKNKLQGKRYCFQTFKTAVQMYFEDGLKKNFLPVHQFFSLLLATKSCCPIMCVQDWISPFQEKDKDSIDQVSGLEFEITPTPWVQRHNAPLWRRSWCQDKVCWREDQCCQGKYTPSSSGKVMEEFLMNVKHMPCEKGFIVI